MIGAVIVLFAGVVTVSAWKARQRRNARKVTGPRAPVLRVHDPAGDARLPRLRHRLDGRP